MTSIGGIGWCPRLGNEKSHYVHRWIGVCQKPGVLGWQFHADCPRLEAIAGVGMVGEPWCMKNAMSYWFLNMDP